MTGFHLIIEHIQKFLLALASVALLAMPLLAQSSGSSVRTAADSAGSTMKFSKEFLSNKIFKDLALNFDPPNPARIDGKLLETGTLIQPNGDILFRIYAPKATDVTLKFDLVRSGELILKKKDDGVFEGLLPYDENHTGPMTVDVYVDGMVFLYPYMPIHWSASRPHNFVEVPDAEMEFMFIKDVPHGAMSREIYWSDVVKSWERSIIYTPPGYMKSNKAYPCSICSTAVGRMRWFGNTAAGSPIFWIISLQKEKLSPS